MARCFVCIEPASDVRNRLSLAAKDIRAFGVPAKYIEPEQYHVNLEFVAEADGRKLESLKECWAGVAARTPPFAIEVAGIDAFPGRARPRVLFAGCVSTQLAGLGREPDFHPHITLARVREAAGNLKGLFESFGSLAFGSFVAKEILLKESVLAREGPMHRTIDTFRLGSG